MVVRARELGGVLLGGVLVDLEDRLLALLRLHLDEGGVVRLELREGRDRVPEELHGLLVVGLGRRGGLS